MRNGVSGAMAHPAGRVFCLTLLRCVSEFNLRKVPILPFTTRPLWRVAQIYTWGEKKTLTLLHCAIFLCTIKTSNLALQLLRNNLEVHYQSVWYSVFACKLTEKKIASKQTETFQLCLTAGADILLIRLLKWGSVTLGCSRCLIFRCIKPTLCLMDHARAEYCIAQVFGVILAVGFGCLSVHGTPNTCFI